MLHAAIQMTYSNYSSPEHIGMKIEKKASNLRAHCTIDTRCNFHCSSFTVLDHTTARKLSKRHSAAVGRCHCSVDLRGVITV